jgi:hypothetical protein
MSKPATHHPIAAANPTLFIPLTLGHTANTIDLLVLTAPPITASADMKARCFDFLADSLLKYAAIYIYIYIYI